MSERLTFAIPTYNRNVYLKALLASIPKRMDIKFAISDNGGFVTKDVLADHIDKISISSPSEVLKMYPNWNRVINMVETEWFLIPSDDDLYYENSLELIDYSLNKYPNADIIIFGHNVINEKGLQLSKWTPGFEKEFDAPKGIDIFKYGVDARFPSIIFKTSFVKRLGGLDESFSFTAADSLFIQKCLIYGNSVFINQNLGSYRTWPNNATNQLVASKEWLDEIDRWQDKVIVEIKGNSIMDIDVRNLKDEVFARNLLSGIAVMKKNGHNLFSRFNFIRSNRFPTNANFRTIVRIVKAMLF